MDARFAAFVERAARRLRPAKMRWDWGEGLLLRALLGAGDQHERAAVAYFAEYARRGLPRVDWSDRCVPGLAALEILARANDNPVARVVVERVANYVRRAPKTAAGGVNHFGEAWMSSVYPSSMWVDSLMMVNVFAARAGRALGDDALTRFAAEQPVAFARVLHDAESGLWHHAWLVRFARAAPGGGAFWLRGNGWALASLIDTLEVLPTQSSAREELERLARITGAALVRHQREDGYWNTLIGRPSYRESSGTAMVAYGLLKGARLGILPGELRAHGERAFEALLAGLEPSADGPSMVEISGPTMPYPAAVYSLLPRGRDLSYGVAALMFAGVEADRP
jgi:unsaturated rhamnogalacturonyl hydrolase